jgi:hypothetical protein
VLRFPGRPTLADFDVPGQKLQEDADPNRQEPALPKIDSMQFVDVAGRPAFSECRIERNSLVSRRLSSAQRQACAQ